MKRRLRKKRRIGEFREDCFELTFEVAPSLDPIQFDAVTDAFIEMIESRGLQCGGGGRLAIWSGVVQGPYRASVTSDDRDGVIRWLREHPMVEDPIVQQIQRQREKYAASFDLDLARIVADLKSRQGRDGRVVVDRTALEGSRQSDVQEPMSSQTSQPKPTSPSP